MIVKRSRDLSSNESSTDDSKKAVSRRGMLKWTGALAAVGIVGVGLGFGGDLLLRPNTTTTETNATTQTETNTVTDTLTNTTTAAGPTTTVTGPITTVAGRQPQLQDQ